MTDGRKPTGVKKPPEMDFTALDAAEGTLVSAPLVEMRGIFKSFGGVHAVEDVSLCVEAGEVLGLLGHNGAGKSTLIKALSGAEPADRGEIRIAGEVATVIDDLGVMDFQDFDESVDDQFGCEFFRGSMFVVGPGRLRSWRSNWPTACRPLDWAVSWRSLTRQRSGKSWPKKIWVSIKSPH